MKTAHRTQACAKRQRYQADPMASVKLINRLEPFTPAELLLMESPIRMSFEAILTGRGTLLRTLHRYHATGRVGFDGPAIADVELGIDLHEQILRLSTPLQMADALREVMRRTAEKQVLQ